MAAKAGSLHHVSNALHAESLACLNGLQHTSSWHAECASGY
jgi:hypothetical protein